MPVWADARKRALNETLELAKLNSPTRAAFTLIPSAAVLIVGLQFTQWPVATAATLAFTLLLALVTFCVLFIKSLADIAGEAKEALSSATDDAARDEEKRRHELVDKLRTQYALSAGKLGVSPAYQAGLRLPPRDWMNEQLELLGEPWRIHQIVGARFTMIDVQDLTWIYKGFTFDHPTAIRWIVLLDELGLTWETAHKEDADSAQPAIRLPQLQFWFDVVPEDSGLDLEATSQWAASNSMAGILAIGAPELGRDQLVFINSSGAVEEGLFSIAEDRRDQGVFLLTREEFMMAFAIGGWGNSTEHDRLPLVTPRIQAAYAAAKAYQFA